jgi:hypothetical protein
MMQFGRQLCGDLDAASARARVEAISPGERRAA